MQAPPSKLGRWIEVASRCSGKLASITCASGQLAQMLQVLDQFWLAWWAAEATSDAEHCQVCVKKQARCHPREQQRCGTFAASTLMPAGSMCHSLVVHSLRS